jgi:hypothetical protein
LLKRSEAAGLASLSITRKTRVVRCIQPTLISGPSSCAAGAPGPAPIRCGAIPTRAPGYRSCGSCRALLQLVVAVLETVVLPVVFLLNCHVSFQAVLFLLVSKLACFGL